MALYQPCYSVQEAPNLDGGGTHHEGSSRDREPQPCNSFGLSMMLVIADRVDGLVEPTHTDYIIPCDSCSHDVWVPALMLEAWAIGIAVVCKPCLPIVRKAP